MHDWWYQERALSDAIKHGEPDPILLEHSSKYREEYEHQVANGVLSANVSRRLAIAQSYLILVKSLLQEECADALAKQEDEVKRMQAILLSARRPAS